MKTSKPTNKKLEKFYKLLEDLSNASFDCGDFKPLGNAKDSEIYKVLSDANKEILDQCKKWAEENIK